MSISYQDFIAVAHELGERRASEGALRTAVGRYYYGTLALVRELFISKPSRTESHSQAAIALGTRTQRVFREKYDELHRLRLAADYEPQQAGWDRSIVRARRLHEQIAAELRRRGFLKD